MITKKITLIIAIGMLTLSTYAGNQQAELQRDMLPLRDVHGEENARTAMQKWLQTFDPNKPIILVDNTGGRSEGSLPLGWALTVTTEPDTMVAYVDELLKAGANPNPPRKAYLNSYLTTQKNLLLSSPHKDVRQKLIDLLEKYGAKE